MKRFITLLAVVLSAVLVLGACGESDDEQVDQENNAEQEVKKKTAGADLQDGTYRLEEKNFDEHGWKTFVEIIVEDGKIKTSDFNYTNKDGQLKTDDQEYQDLMKDEAGVGPQEFVSQLNENLISVQDAQLVDVVTGATHSSEAFINYTQQLIQAAQAGNTDTIIIHNGDTLQDGEYSLAEANLDENGWKVITKIVVDGGKITQSDYNYLNADGELKTGDDGYQERMTEKNGVGPQDYIPTLNHELVEKQDAAEVDIVTGATSSSVSFKNYAAQLINAAEKGNNEEIIVDNIVYEKE